MVTLSTRNAQDCVALAEIEWCGELMIAASAAREERLSPDRIDEVLDVRSASRTTAVDKVSGDTAFGGKVISDTGMAERLSVPRQHGHGHGHGRRR